MPPSAPWICRSEERRVGKECRSLCDWSSDVCSSDLAFQSVADTLTALDQDAEGLKAAGAAADAAKRTLDLSQRQLQAGYANELSLLSAEQSYQQALISLIQAQANRYADTAALFQALGGGWWNRAELVQDKDGK